ncbi:hypothetical protein AKG11_10305 [Shinella sp. SUS2]|nr:hypothetical protein AKG11_10305 [Shinella sp. SUS2]KOC73225.1 hypothetical protein AKG10_22605 [Shinella sp. GWS1]
MFGWLRRVFTSRPVVFDEVKRSISLDISGDPDFDDYAPPRERLEVRLRGSNLVSPEAKEFIVKNATMHIRKGGSSSGFMKLLKSALPDESADSVAEAARLLRLEEHRCRTLHNLRRMEEADVTHCTLSSAGDERDTSFEKKMNGKRMTLSQARNLTLERSDDFPRSVFRGEVKF